MENRGKLKKSNKIFLQRRKRYKKKADSTLNTKTKLVTKYRAAARVVQIIC